MENRYQIMLVDDEPIILRSLKIALPWEQLQIDIVGDAANGEEALLMARQLKPDIIISDIRMPSMDGIFFMKEILKEYPGVIFIFLSGYSEFSYAREAMRFGAFDYLLKPIDHEELHKVLLKAKAKLDKTRLQKRETEILRKSMQSLSTLVRERMFVDLIEGRAADSKHSYWLENWELEHPYHTMIILIDQDDLAAKRWNQDEVKLWLFAIGNILAEFGEKKDCFTMFPFHRGEWIMIFQNKTRDELVEYGRELIGVIHKFTKLLCSVGISGKFRGLDQLSASYADAQTALLQKFFEPGKKIYTADVPVINGATDYPKAIENELVQALHTMNAQRLRETAEKLHEHLRQNALSKEQAVNTMLQMVVVLQREAENLRIHSESNANYVMDIIFAADNLAEMIFRFAEYFGNMIAQNVEKGNEESSRALIEKAREFIASRYYYDMSVDEAAEFVGLSCSYFCVLFKQETGLTFLEYLTKYRIEKACEILRNPDVKVYQIGPLVGYQDARYFTQVFKKIIGLTPTEYRVKSYGSAGAASRKGN
ncbi:MAG TPA: response regulator [Bacilli bacterium]